MKRIRFQLTIILIVVSVATIIAQNNSISVENMQGENAVILKADSAYYNGQIILNNTKDQIGVQIDGSEGVGGGQINLFNSKNIPTLQIDAEGGSLESFIHLRNSTDVNTFSLQSNDANNRYGASMQLKRNDGKTGVRLDGSEGEEGGQINLYDSNGIGSIQIDSEGGCCAGSSFIEFRDNQNTPTIWLHAKRNNNLSSRITMMNDEGINTVIIDGQEAAGNGSTLKMYDNTGKLSIELDAEYGAGGKGRVITQVLEITGGSDIAESFEISNNEKIKPGLLLSIDKENPAKLTLTKSAYDKNIAGIVSGANGIDVGMVLAQAGTLADGDVPVTISGRVYVYAVALKEKIEPGDLLTSSSLPGYAMKVTKKKKAFGAIIGKALTPLEKGEKGMILVLVNLQ